MWDINPKEIMFFISILLCISLGRCYRRIDDPSMKKNYGAGLGFLTTCLICGHYLYHSAIMVWGNIIILKCCNRRNVHKISLAYTWAYLLFLHLNLQNCHHVIWLHQTMALRLVGLAFELHSAEKATEKESKPEDESLCNVPPAAEIIAYAYFFVGIHRGPYYSMKVFNDHFDMSIAMLDDCSIITEHKLRKAFLFSLGFLLLRMKSSPKIYQDEDFYENYPADFRYLYNIPQLLMFFVQYQIMMTLCTSVATESGFGIYPAKALPLPGQGPSAKLSLVNMDATTSSMVPEQEYNFTMLKCFDNQKVLLGPRMCDTMRGWDMPTRYWFWNNIYKNTNSKAKKEVRSAWSFLAWTLWCGPSLQQVILSTTLWVHLHLEKEYSELFNTGGSMKIAWAIGFSIMRVFCLVYLTPCLVINDYHILLTYYNSILWAYHIFLLALIIAAAVISRSK